VSPGSSTFLSEQTSNQPAVLFSHNKPAPAISHQPNEQAADLKLIICIQAAQKGTYSHTHLILAERGNERTVKHTACTPTVHDSQTPAI
jgi:hypothetical protein